MVSSLCDSFVSYFYSEPLEARNEKTIVSAVQGLAYDGLSCALAREHGLNIQTVSWEDTARFKNSCWGPNISDMTLQVKDAQGFYHRMPVIRQPNFSDKTQDVPIDCLSVWVGNETGNENLSRLPLKEYLSQFHRYCKNGTVKGSLLCERDAQVIHSVQACFLPAAVKEDVHFNVALFNYQSYQGHPAVLTIVVSSHRASAQIIDNGNGWDGQKLFFDKNGKGCDFAANRLKDVRADAGKAVLGDLCEKEQEDRKLQIIQIPLKVVPPAARHPVLYNDCCFKGGCCESTAAAAGIDDAQLRIGNEIGDFAGLNGVSIERDDRFPIRVTTQIYKITDDGKIGREQMDKIAAEIKKEEAVGHNGSSLVLEETNRPTEWKKI